MKQATTKGLYQYWNTVRGKRLAPRRYEIEPSQIIPYLSETLILEQPALAGCRVRVAGTKVCEWLGDDLRGQLFFELWSEEDWLVLHDNLHAVVTHGAAGLFRFIGALADDQPTVEFEMLLLPLTHLEEHIERVLGSISLVHAPDWLETSYPARLALTSNEIIWPDGRPHAFALRSRRSDEATDAGRSTPALRADAGASQFRRARLVRSDQRSFLVYDGGKSDREPNPPPGGLRPEKP